MKEEDRERRSKLKEEEAVANGRENREAEAFWKGDCAKRGRAPIISLICGTVRIPNGSILIIRLDFLPPKITFFFLVAIFFIGNGHAARKKELKIQFSRDELPGKIGQLYYAQ